jgi:hypothetical protein
MFDLITTKFFYEFSFFDDFFHFFDENSFRPVKPVGLTCRWITIVGRPARLALEPSWKEGGERKKEDLHKKWKIKENL